MQKCIILESDLESDSILDRKPVHYGSLDLMLRNQVQLQLIRNEKLYQSDITQPDAFVTQDKTPFHKSFKSILLILLMDHVHESQGTTELQGSIQPAQHKTGNCNKTRCLKSSSEQFYHRQIPRYLSSRVPSDMSRRATLKDTGETFPVLDLQNRILACLIENLTENVDET